jgi:methylenetetrahydrofolate reductase (NADPH)
LTCAGASKDEVMKVIGDYKDAGVEDIVALRGDPVGGATQYEPHENGFRDSCELIETLAKDGSFNIRVGAYPESHPDAESPQQNIEYLKAKFESGATEALTQFFFEAETFLRFRDACDKAGIAGQITPGILPVTNWSRTKNFAKRCGASVSDELAQGFERAEREDRAYLFALVHATEMCDALIREGVTALHFYTLNRAELTRQVCRALDIGGSATIRDVT